MKSSGPRIEPCGTAASTKDHFDDWPLKRPFDVYCLKMTILSCSNYHIFLKALVYKEGQHARLDQRL